jgi:hypothetical protein
MPPGLRVKRYRRIPGAWETTWDYEQGRRALFKYGEERRAGHVHIVWIMLGDHTIL